LPKEHVYTDILAEPFVPDLAASSNGQGLLGYVPTMKSDDRRRRVLTLAVSLGLGQFDFEKQGMEAFWQEMALRLAARHVPGFQPVERRQTKPRTWTFELRAQLFRDVEEMRRNKNLSEPAACRYLARREPYRRLGPRGRGPKPDTLLRQLTEAKIEHRLFSQPFGAPWMTNGLLFGGASLAGMNALLGAPSSGGLLGGGFAPSPPKAESRD
jgi:hypothetical protein